MGVLLRRFCKLKFFRLGILLMFLLTPGTGNTAPYDIAVLQALDKVTARVFTIKIVLGEVFKFGTLEIVARHCDKRPPEETPESTAFLEIADFRPGGARFIVYQGWMFASSPALSAMEHPIYDVWVVNCLDDK